MAFLVEQTLIIKFLKFGVVGVAGTAIDFGFTYLFKEKLKMNKYWANGIAYMLGATNNFFLNKIWAFNDTGTNIIEQYVKFVSISAIGLGFSTFIIYLLVTRWKQNFYLSKVIATFIVLVWNFGANLLFTFK